ASGGGGDSGSEISGGAGGGGGAGTSYYQPGKVNNPTIGVSQASGDGIVILIAWN
ncbi:MAG: formylglycine-generating enzyme family protein, partial [Chloroflexi bacterium]|nr:formylglycine-generating enzyme family protein [Chloroflexota bacterium]